MITSTRVLALAVFGLGSFTAAVAQEFGNAPKFALPEDEFFWGRDLINADSMSVAPKPPTPKPPTPKPPTVPEPTPRPPTPPAPTPGAVTPPPTEPQPTPRPPTPPAPTPGAATPPPTEPQPTPRPPTAPTPTEPAPTEAPPTGNAPTETPPTDETIAAILAADDRFTTLVDLVVGAGLLPPLEGEGPLTVFAPTNAAFAILDLPPDTDPDVITDVLLYHVVGEEVEIVDGLSVTTLNGEDVVLTDNDTGSMVNDANIIEGIDASNGIIYVIDAVLIPPSFPSRERRLLRTKKYF